MTTRRTFIGTTAAALAATAARATVADAHVLTDASPQQGGTLPPAIAALTPMTAGVKPITVDERRARIEKATRLMREQQIDALMLTGGTSLEYFTNIRWGLSERMLALVIPDQGHAVHRLPEVRGRARDGAGAHRPARQGHRGARRGRRTTARRRSSPTASGRAGSRPAR